MNKDIKSIYAKYNGKSLADCGCVVSAKYKSFQDAFVRVVKAIAAIEGGEVVKSSKGYYYVSGINRTKIDFSGRNLYCRSVESVDDYTGDMNYFCSLEDLPHYISKILNKS